jgi:fatty acid desaturase
MLRYTSDIRTLLWAAAFPVVALAHYARPELCGYLAPVSLYLGFCSGVFSHNQNHCPTFKGKWLNAIYAAYLSFFYGYPTFGWIPTHNLNHHKFVNKAGDATITWRISRENNLWTAFSYFFLSVYHQAEPIQSYIRKARSKGGTLFRQIMTQYAVVALGHVTMLALGVWLHGWARGFLVYFFGFGLMSLFALWSMIFINYIQHVHCDPWDAHNHSRNFVSKVGNFLVFNNGFHAAHHENAGLHWSKLPEAHAKIADKIHPELNQSSIFAFCFRVYILGFFFERFRTKQIGRPAYEPPGEAPLDLRTADVDAVEAGTNAEMA